MIGIIYAILMIWISNSPVNSLQNIAFLQATSSELSPREEFIAVLSQCNEETAMKWKSDFHDCFVGKKYDDGGRNLEHIMDRILSHAEACVETSFKECRPDYGGFNMMIGEVLEQMKDYSNMYLEEIHSGRDKIKDLTCVEDTLSIAGYERCFRDLPAAINENEYEIQNAVRRGIRCTNRENIECSKEARTSLNRIVRTLFGMEQPPEEEEMDVKPEPPPPKKWYDYIAEPFVTAWTAVKDFFVRTFG